MTEHGKDAYAPKSIYHLLNGCDDPAEPYRREFLQLLGVQDDRGWSTSLDCMIGYIQRHRDDERKHQSRAAARETLKKVGELATELVKLTGDNDVIETLRTYAPASTGGPGDITGYEYLVALADRATRARNRITTGPGGHTLFTDLGKPTAFLLCAVMVCAAWKKQHGRMPSEKSQPALKACEALWVAAGGPASSNVDADRWVRHLRAARDTKAHSRQVRDAQATPEQRQANDPALIKDRKVVAFVLACKAAEDCLSYLQQE